MRITSHRIFIVLGVTLSCWGKPAFSQDSVGSLIDQANHAYHESSIDQARTLYDQALVKAESMQDSRQRWWALMSSAWFESVTGQFGKSIEHSNQALKIAALQNDSFLIGRSLCWLGWAYAATGRYQAAIKFYEQAAELGAPKGRIKLVPVWGLATQELGALYFKMGDSKSARLLLEKTLQYAREHNISVGISEGGVELAEVALNSGNLSEALSLANEAIEAAYDCNCSHFNTARALLFKGKVLLQLAQNDAQQKPPARDQIQKALEFSEKNSVLPVVAEAKMLLSRTLEPESFEKRKELLEQSLAIVRENNFEIQGKVSADLGSLFLEQKSKNLATFYLAHGLSISQQTLRAVDEAFILTEQAALDAKSPTELDRTSLQTLIEATDKALANDSLMLATENQIKISDMYRKSGFDQLSLKWALLARNNLAKLLEKDAPEANKRATQLKYLQISERVAELSLRFTEDSSPKQPENVK